MYRTLLIALSLFGLTITYSTPADATSGFNAGRIIDDSVFTNKNSMSVSDIQKFLNSKVPTCDTNGERLSEYGGPDLNGDGKVQRWEWGKQRYNQSTFPCLKDYTVDGVSAAQLIYNTAQTYSINPQTLIVLLQKEQGLVTDTWPLNIQYRSATGYGCPDTAACDSKYYGLKNQLTWAATMFRAILNNSSTWYTPYVLGNNYIQYNPDASCGGSTVNIQNRSTQALYNYTPYQPNQATLDANMGQVVHCGAYGNIHFYQYFNSWFGNTQGSFSSMSNPRWMQLKSATRKINPSTGQEFGDQLSSGQQIMFASKIDIANGPCLRTQHDTKNSSQLCIPINLIDELNISYTPTTSDEKIMMLTQASYKQNLRTNHQNSSFPLQKDQRVSFDTKTSIGGILYYITKNDYTKGIEYGIPASRIEPSATYEAMTPLLYRLNADTQKLNPLQNRKIEPILGKNIIIQFASRTQIDGVWYYRTSHDTNKDFDKAISQDSLIEVFDTFQKPRWMITVRDIQKINPINGEVSNVVIKKGTPIFFTTKTELKDGSVHFRTKHDTDNNIYLTLPANSLTDVNYENFQQPRWLVVNKNTQQVSPYTGASVASISEGTQLRFTSKIEINDIVYFRDETNTSSRTDVAIKSTDLSEIQYTSFLHPRELKLTSDTRKQIPTLNTATGDLMPKGMIRKYVTKIEVNDKVYFRTENDTKHNLNLAIDSNLLTEL